MSTKTPPRAPAGTSQGGQFIAYAQDQQGGALEPGTDAWYDADAETALAAVFTPGCLDDLQAAVDIAARKYPGVAGDLLGETYAALHAKVASAHANHQPVNLAEARNPRAIMTLEAKNQGYKLTHHGIWSGDDVKAWRKFGDRKDALEARLGRPLTLPERLTVAEEVRQSEPNTKRRPSQKFFTAVAEDTTAPVDYNLGRKDPSEEEAAPEERGDGWSAGLGGSPVMREMIRIKNGDGDGGPAGDGPVKRGAAERMVYALAACEHGAPLPADGSLTDKAWYGRHKKAIAAAGGAGQAAADWRAGRCTPEAEEALFAPVTPPGGTLTREEKRAVCDALEHFPGGADKTYQALVNTVLQGEASWQRQVAGRS